MHMIRVLLGFIKKSFLFFAFIGIYFLVYDSRYVDAGDILSYAENMGSYEYYEFKISQIFTNSEFFRLILYFIYTFDFDIYVSLFLIGSISFAIIFFVLTKNNILTLIIPLLLFTHPIVLDLLFSQVRSGLALSLFILALNTERIYLRLAFLLISAMTHMFVFLLISFYAIFSLLKFFHLDKKYLRFLFFRMDVRYLIGIVFSLIFFVIAHSQAASLNIRGTEYHMIGLFYTMMHFMTMVIYLSLFPHSLNNYGSFFYVLLILVASLGFFLPIYSHRFIALSIPFLALGLSQIYLKYQLRFFPVIIVNVFLSYYYWL